MFVIFGKKKLASNEEKLYFNVAIITVDEVGDEQYDAWTDEFMDAADNVGSTTALLQADWEGEQKRILIHRFPHLDLKEPIFMINEINHKEIEKEIKHLEQKHKWKKFFNAIPLSDYLDAEDRVVMDASKTLFCTNDVQQVIEYLQGKATKRDS